MAVPDRPTPPPRPKLGGQTKAAAAPLRGGKGFVPPTIHRQKVAVARAHETPQAPPTVEPAAPPTVSSPKVVAETQAIETPVAPLPRTKPVRIPPRPVAEPPQEPQTIAEPVAEAEPPPQAEPSVEIAPPVEATESTPIPQAASTPHIAEPDTSDAQDFFAEPVAEIPLDVDVEDAVQDAPAPRKSSPPPTVFIPVQVKAGVEPSTASAAAKSKSAVIDPTPAPDPVPIPARRPMLRYYLGGAIGMLFLLISALMAGLWVHSFGAIDRAVHATVDGQYTWIESSAGAIYFHAERDTNPIARQADVWRLELGDAFKKNDLPPPKIPRAAWQGVTVANVPTAGGANVGYVVISYWLVVIALALPGLWWLKNRQRLRALCRGMKCLRCGYDLRHSPDRCPECGMPGPRSAQVTAELQQEFERQ